MYQIISHQITSICPVPRWRVDTTNGDRSILRGPQTLLFFMMSPVQLDPDSFRWMGSISGKGVTMCASDMDTKKRLKTAMLRCCLACSRLFAQSAVIVRICHNDSGKKVLGTVCFHTQ